MKAEPVVVVGGASAGQSGGLAAFCSLLKAAGYSVEFCPQPSPDPGNEYMSSAVASVIAKIHAVGRSCHVIGYSLGSLTALHLALEYPSDCRSLVLIAARARTTDYQAAVARALVEVAARCTSEAFAALTVELSLSDTTLVDPDRASDWVDLFAAGPQDVETYSWWVDGSLVSDLRPRLSGVVMPVLVLSFENDRLVRPMASHELADSLPQAISIDLPGLGHLGIVEAPSAVASPVLSFLAAAV